MQELQWVTSEVGAMLDPEGNSAIYAWVTLRARDGEQWLVAGGEPLGMFSPRYGWWYEGGHDPPWQAVDQFEVFGSLLRLVGEPVDWGRLDACVPPEAALKWCQTYGLPAVEARNREDGQEWLRVSTFQRHTLILSLLFKLWVALVYEQWAQLDAPLTALGADPGLLPDMDHQGKQRRAQNALQTYLNARIRHIGPGLIWPLKDHQGDLRPDGAPYLTFYASSLFDYVFSQLTSLLLKPASDVKSHLKLCRGCTRYFWGHGNRRYCARSGCDRRTLWSRTEKGRAARQRATTRAKRALGPQAKAGATR